MKNNKIALKLSINFAIALLMFSIIIGSVFFYFFRSYTIDVHKNELIKYADSLTTILSSEESPGHFRKKDSYGSYVRFVVNVANIDVWLLDENMELTTIGRGFGKMSADYNLATFTPNIKELIKNVFQGETAFSKGFSETLNQPSLTLGTPIKENNDKVIGALFLHSAIEGTNLAVKKGLSILLVSMILALVITSMISIFLSFSFTKPLNKMKDVALKLSEGDYLAKCDVLQDDEIGELANVIDLLSDRLLKASNESGKLEKLRRDFVANISHELRTPITVIRGSLEALNDKVVSEASKVDEYYTQMLNEAKFLERLVNDLLDLSKLQNIDFVIEKTEVNLNDILQDVIRSAKQLADRKNIEIKIVSSTEIINIQGDYGRLRQLFLILIDNAIKFSPNNSLIEILVSKQEISIKDYGPVIAEDDLPYIFNRFYKTVGEENKSGTGLGLAIAKQIADHHNIQLTATNHLDGGTEFVCNISNLANQNAKTLKRP